MVLVEGGGSNKVVKRSAVGASAGCAPPVPGLCTDGCTQPLHGTAPPPPYTHRVGWMLCWGVWDPDLPQTDRGVCVCDGGGGGICNIPSALLPQRRIKQQLSRCQASPPPTHSPFTTTPIPVRPPPPPVALQQLSPCHPSGTQRSRESGGGGGAKGGSVLTAPLPPPSGCRSALPGNRRCPTAMGRVGRGRWGRRAALPLSVRVGRATSGPGVGCVLQWHSRGASLRRL